MALRQAAGDALLFVVVKPNRQKSALLGLRSVGGRSSDESLSEVEIALSAPPSEGAANAELLTFLSDVLGVPKRMLELDSGHTSRHKVVRFRSTRPEDVKAALARAGCPVPD